MSSKKITINVTDSFSSDVKQGLRIFAEHSEIPSYSTTPKGWEYLFNNNPDGNGVYSIAKHDDTALPYYPFSFKECRKINCLQLPVFCMDGNLINQIRNINEALKTISKFIETIMDNQGIGIIDWHAECSLPKRNSYFKWGETYNILLKELSQYDCILGNFT